MTVDFPAMPLPRTRTWTAADHPGRRTAGVRTSSTVTLGPTSSALTVETGIPAGIESASIAPPVRTTAAGFRAESRSAVPFNSRTRRWRSASFPRTSTATGAWRCTTHAGSRTPTPAITNATARRTVAAVIVGVAPMPMHSSTPCQRPPPLEPRLRTFAPRSEEEQSRWSASIRRRTLGRRARDPSSQ